MTETESDFNATFDFEIDLAVLTLFVHFRGSYSAEKKMQWTNNWTDLDSIIIS